jgi:hypothetical protein
MRDTLPLILWEGVLEADSGLDTQYNDVMRGAANHPRALSRAERGVSYGGRGEDVWRQFYG